MKQSNSIQRFFLFLLILVFAAPAWATDYGREDYEIFRSRETVKQIGKNKQIRSPLRKGHVEIDFDYCKTTSGTGSGAIYELENSTYITVNVDNGYAIRWIILRDTEGGKSYNHPDGIKRITNVTNGYDFYFEKYSITNSRISEGNKEDLNDDNNNIVVYNYDAPAQSIKILTHHISNWGKFKVRDIIVGIVKSPDVQFNKSNYEAVVGSRFLPQCQRFGHTGHIVTSCDNENIAEYNSGNLYVYPKKKGVTTIHLTFQANDRYAKSSCETNIHVRDGVNFYAKGNWPKVLFTKDNDVQSRYIYDYVGVRLASGDTFDRSNSEFQLKSDNTQILNVTDKQTGKLVFGNKSGTVSITLTQGQNHDYAGKSETYQFTVVRGDKNSNTMYIRDKDEWKLFASLVNDKGMTNLNAKLDGDIDLGTDITMVGANGVINYSGTFDGQGHTISLDWNTTHGFTALFNSVNGATIKNLHTKGVISNYVHFTSGLVMIVYGSVTLSNCVSEVNFNHTNNERECFTAGLISFVKADAQVTINDCIVKGKILPSSNVENVIMDGFVGPQEGGSVSTLNNCLYIDSNPRDHIGTVSYGKIIVNNCYSLSDHRVARYTQVNAEQLKSGEVAYKLQAGRSNRVWGQVLGTDNEPSLTTEVKKHVNKVDFTYRNNVILTRYANTDNSIYGSLPTLPQVLSTAYNPHHYYEFTFEGGFRASTIVNNDRKVNITLDEKDYYTIASKDNWKSFCAIVNSGQNAVDAKMTNDVYLYTDITMAGDGKRYAGTFDGQGHMLKINWDGVKRNWLAPFQFVENATIKNLRTEGVINSTSFYLSGLIAGVYGTVSISRCVSNVNIKSSYVGSSCDVAGMAAYVNDAARITFDDCIVKGTFNGMESGREGMSGFVYSQNGTCILNNCLYIGNNNAENKYSYTFAKNSTVNNCYYLNACGREEQQGTKVTATQLKNGEVTKKLQNGRTDNSYWAQVLGEMPSLYDNADKGKTNYIYYKVYNGWTCENFVLTDGTSLPIGIDFLATQATYERKLSNKYNATICLPYELPARGNGSFEAAYTISGGNGSKAYFKPVNDKLEAYKPYYITAPGWSGLTLHGYNVQVKAFKADNLTESAADYKLVGTVDGMNNADAAAVNAYILQNDGMFHRVTTAIKTAMIPPYRAYIICPKTIKAEKVSAVIDGETTDIDDVTDGTTDINAAVYDLQGRRMADRLDDNTRRQLPAGVYIVGGRKVILK